MRRIPLTLTLTATLAMPAPAVSAADLATRLAALEGRIQDLEQRVQAQDTVIRERDQTIARLQDAADSPATAAPEAGGGGGPDRVQVTGLVEMEAQASTTFEDDDHASDLVLATVEVGIAAQVTPWVGAEVVLLYEDDGGTALDVDVGAITLAPPHGPWAVTAGQFYLPFGTFETHMVTDPLTLELGETRESALMAGFVNGGLAAVAYGFNGENDPGGDDDIGSWGATLGYGVEGSGVAVAGQVGYLSNLGDSDALQEALDPTAPGRAEVGAWFASAVVSGGRFTVIAEYLAAAETFAPGELDSSRAKPHGWNLEAGVGFDLSGREATYALGVQGTADALALGLPKERILTALSLALFPDTTLSLEWAHDRDYPRGQGGTGNRAETVTAQVAVAF